CYPRADSACETAAEALREHGFVRRELAWLRSAELSGRSWSEPLTRDSARNSPRCRPREAARMGRMTTLPSGTVTFAFTHIEGPPALLKRLGERYAELIADHRRIVRDSFGEHAGVEIDMQGDSFFFAF